MTFRGESTPGCGYSGRSVAVRRNGDGMERVLFGGCLTNGLSDKHCGERVESVGAVVPVDSMQVDAKEGLRRGLHRVDRRRRRSRGQAVRPNCYSDGSSDADRSVSPLRRAEAFMTGFSGAAPPEQKQAEMIASWFSEVVGDKGRSGCSTGGDCSVCSSSWPSSTDESLTPLERTVTLKPRFFSESGDYDLVKSVVAISHQQHSPRDRDIEESSPAVAARKSTATQPDRLQSPLSAYFNPRSGIDPPLLQLQPQTNSESLAAWFRVPAFSAEATCANVVEARSPAPLKLVTGACSLAAGTSARALGVEGEEGIKRDWVEEGVVPPLPDDHEEAGLSGMKEALMSGWSLSKRYEIVELLGVGAYGSVFEAWDSKEQRRVAVKRVTNVSDSDLNLKRILREISILSQLEHKHIVKMLDVSSVGTFDEMYIVMERCDTDLRKVCMNPLGVTLSQARKLSYCLVLGCMYLHSASVYHRDLKPANCLADRADCHVRICDFNLAREVARRGSSLCFPGDDLCVSSGDMDENCSKTSSSLESSTTCSPLVPRRMLTMQVATRWYRPPEVILCVGYSEAIDVWSAGCIIAELFVALNEGGRTPRRGALFPGDDDCCCLSEDSCDSDAPVGCDGDQLDVIFDVLGTPSAEELAAIPTVAARQHVSSYMERPGRGLAAEMPIEASSEGIDLLRQLLRIRPGDRITMMQAARHPFFSRMWRLEDEQNSVAQKGVNIGVDEDVLEATTSSNLHALRQDIGRLSASTITPSRIGSMPMGSLEESLHEVGSMPMGSLEESLHEVGQT